MKGKVSYQSKKKTPTGRIIRSPIKPTKPSTKAGPMPTPKRKPASAVKSTKASRTARSKAVGKVQMADRARSTGTKRGSSTTRATKGAESLAKTRTRSQLRPADPRTRAPGKQKETPGKIIRRPVKPTMPGKKKSKSY